MNRLSGKQDAGKTSILVVDDDPAALKNIVRILKTEGYQTTAVSGGKEAMDALRSSGFDIVLTDLVMEPIDGLEIMAEAKKMDREIEVIIFTGYGSVESAIEATKRGAFHYVQKPIRSDEFRNIVRRAAEKRQLVLKVRNLECKVADDFPTIIGNSPKIIAVKELIRRIADSESNVIITGESGTGKELVARAIHESSTRRGKRFMAVNCASLTEELLANELFGHEKDAFTGATYSKSGLLESAHGGTVFLDEIGDMPGAMQAKLLRVIQEKELIRVGGTTPVAVDIRIIAATNKDLKRLTEAGIFRQDLYYRLHVISIHMPSLSERLEDIPLLALHFLNRHVERTGKRCTGFSSAAIGLLLNYGYPGNVRELENIVERAASFARGESIEIEDLPADLKDFESFTYHHPERKMKTLEELESEYVRWVLDRTGKNKSEAARILGIDRVSLYRKLKKLEFKE